MLFVTISRAGIFMTGQFGSGVVIARTPDGGHFVVHPPNHVDFFLGMGLGLQMGMDVTD